MNETYREELIRLISHCRVGTTTPVLNKYELIVIQHDPGNVFAWTLKVLGSPDIVTEGMGLGHVVVLNIVTKILEYEETINQILLGTIQS